MTLNYQGALKFGCMLETPVKSLVPVFIDGKNLKNKDNQQETKSLLN
jgi:hypothetical protein